ncbi:hypothetical protein [Erythrobacter sp.]|uniref:hypothetical protein n=1 Tax=Erythrobacter sp. TaxID=1042 RepID=UPI001425DFAD|nr:hypothetical protein [Erythrobacter sp.]QIQ85839.1 MAG: hypothetical protein G9473_03425 [Erythrobacter sp.]
MNFRILFALAGAFALAACNPVEQFGIAEERIDTFHARYNEGDAGALYAMTGETFREVTDPEDMGSLVAMFTARLGRIESSERSGFNTSFNNGLNVTTVTMDTQFEQGAGTETYIFHGTGEDMELVGWQVNSPRLMLSPEEMRMLSENEGTASPELPERRVIPERSAD